MIYEYLIFNIFILSGPLLLFFWKRKDIFKPRIRPLLISIFLAATIFAIWDQLVVNYFWSFNPDYITGLFLADLPIEEVLFFITVPFACLFLWVNYNKRVNHDEARKLPLILILLAFLLGALLLSKRLVYSGSVSLIFSLVMMLDVFLKTKLFTKKSFLFFIFFITNALTFIFNLYLTARPVVVYNELVKTNINILTIPIEDFVFGMALISLTIIIYEKILSKRFFINSFKI